MQLHMPESNWWPNIIHIVHWLIQFPFSFLMYIGNPQKACFRTECTRSTWKGQRKRQKKCHERRSLLIISLASLNWIWLIAKSYFSPSHPKTISKNYFHFWVCKFKSRPIMNLLKELRRYRASTLSIAETWIQESL